MTKDAMTKEIMYKKEFVFKKSGTTHAGSVGVSGKAKVNHKNFKKAIKGMHKMSRKDEDELVGETLSIKQEGERGASSASKKRGLVTFGSDSESSKTTSSSDDDNSSYDGGTGGTGGRESPSADESEEPRKSGKRTKKGTAVEIDPDALETMEDGYRLCKVVEKVMHSTKGKLVDAAANCGKKGGEGQVRQASIKNCITNVENSMESLNDLRIFQQIKNNNGKPREPTVKDCKKILKAALKENEIACKRIADKK